MPQVAAIGDKRFEALAALFSGFAICGLVYSTILQRMELKKSLKQLEITAKATEEYAKVVKEEFEYKRVEYEIKAKLRDYASSSAYLLSLYQECSDLDNDLGNATTDEERAQIEERQTFNFQLRRSAERHLIELTEELEELGEPIEERKPPTPN